MTGTYLLDYGAGNVRSLVNAVKKLGHDITFVKDPSDILKADASWRHDFPNKLFSLYTPSVEWNRAYLVNNVPADYILLQQEIGVGVTAIAKPKLNLRLGIAENIFNVWQTTEPQTSS